MLSPLRRATVFVSDIERSLAFYRDLLGMELFYDQVIDAPEASQFLGVEGAKTRVVSLQAAGEPFGMVGLASFLEPAIKPRRLLQERVDGPDLLLLFSDQQTDVCALHQRMVDAGQEILCEPLEYEVPERGLISGFTSTDPDGVLVAVMRFGGLSNPGLSAISPLRRAAIIVDDMNESLRFYRDVMGLRVFYDHEISSPEEGLLLGLPGARVRVVSLQAGDSVTGMVGLVEVIEPRLAPRRPAREGIAAPDVALIFVTETMETVHQRLVSAGVRMQADPLEYEIPQRGRCTGMSCYDPNGLLVDITQLSPLKSPR